MNNDDSDNTMPEYHSLKHFEWQIFGVLTFKNYHPPAQRLAMFFALMRKFAQGHRLYWKSVLWILKQEYGKGDDVPHYHFVVAGLPSQVICATSLHSIRDDWMKMNGSLSLVKPYIEEMDGLKYVLKRSDEKSSVTRSDWDNLDDIGGLLVSDSISEFLNRGVLRSNIQRVASVSRTRDISNSRC